MNNYEKLCKIVGINNKWQYLVVDYCNSENPEHLFEKNEFIDFIKKSGEEWLLLSCLKKKNYFTAEKQIELIELLSVPFICAINSSPIGSTIISVDDYSETNDNFEEALAGLTLQLINAGELDKDEVKRILE